MGSFFSSLWSDSLQKKFRKKIDTLLNWEVFNSKCKQLQIWKSWTCLTELRTLCFWHSFTNFLTNCQNIGGVIILRSCQIFQLDLSLSINLAISKHKPSLFSNLLFSINCFVVFSLRCILWPPCFVTCLVAKLQACLYVGLSQTWLPSGRSPFEAGSVKSWLYCWGLQLFQPVSTVSSVDGHLSLLWQLPKCSVRPELGSIWAVPYLF